MRVLFVTPKLGSWATHGHHVAPNQMHAHWAAFARREGSVIPSVLDCKALELSQEQMLSAIKAENPEVAVLGDVLHSYGGFAVQYHFNESAKLIKQALPDVKIVVGGLWYSCMGPETLRDHPAVDYVVLGEGEVSFHELMAAMNAGKVDIKSIPGIAGRENGEIVMGPPRDMVKDLDTLPMPAYDLFPMHKYVGHTYWKPFAEIVTSRGCPHGCTFCYEWSEHDPRSKKLFYKWRAKSAMKVVDEVELLEKEYGVKVIVIQEDNFNINGTRAREFAKEKIKRGLDMKWVSLGCASDWARAEPDIPLMKESGLFMGVFGIEVASDEELRKLDKGITVDQIYRTIEVLRKNDIAIVGDIMIGFDYDNEKIIKDRFDFADKVDPDILWTGYVTPPPGSPIWDDAVKNGWIDPNNIDIRKWDFLHPVVPTKHLSIEDLGRLGAWCMREFFSKPGRIHRILESNFDELAKLCFQDVMNNIPQWEKGALEGELHI